MARKKKENTEQLLKTIVEALAEKKAEGVVSLHVGKLSNAICEYFVVCSAESSTQVDAIASNVEDRILELCSEKPWKIGGYDNGIWIIIDYVDIVVHVFQTEWRQFYRLEELWADAPRVDYTDEAPAAIVKAVAKVKPAAKVKPLAKVKKVAANPRKKA